MKFRNTRNGRILELADNFSGKYWESVEQSAPKKPEKQETKKLTAAKKK